jgi:elongation factor 1-gamma
MPSSSIFSINLPSQYLSKLHNKLHLLGSAGTIEQEALVLSYVSWANQELLATLARWFLPLIPGFSDPAPYDFDAIEKGRAASLVLLAKLEKEIMKGKKGGETRWLVGDGPTLADIFVTIVVSRGLQWVLGREWREQHPGIMAYFERVRNWEPVRKVIPHFVLIEEETRNVDPATMNA